MCVVLFATENKTTPAHIGRQVIVIAIVPRSFFLFFFSSFLFFWRWGGLLMLSMQAEDIYYIGFEERYNQYSLICLIISRLIY